MELNLNHHPWWVSAVLGGLVVLFFEGLAIVIASALKRR